MLATNLDPLRTDANLLEVSPSPVVSAVFRGLLESHEKQGYHQGYRTAVIDILGSLRLLAEEFAHHDPAHDPTRRQVVQEFEAYVKRHILPQEL